MTNAIQTFFPIRSKYLPTNSVVTRAEVERVSQPTVRNAIMGEFKSNLVSKDFAVRTEAARLTAENCAQYSVIAPGFVAQLPAIMMLSWMPLPVVASRLPAVLGMQVGLTSAMNYIAMERFNASVAASKP